MNRRLKEDRNQHYNDLDCPCWTDPKAMARFKEQPKLCSCWMCRNRRQGEGETIQEVRAADAAELGVIEWLNDWA
jgi:hypothetical protein